MEKLLKEKKSISERRVAVHVAIPVLVTLEWLHNAGIIHRWRDREGMDDVGDDNAREISVSEKSTK